MNEVFEFPVRAPAEYALVQRLKEATYEFTGRVSIAQVIGCFEIALDEIKEAQ